MSDAKTTPANSIPKRIARASMENLDGIMKNSFGSMRHS